VQGTLSNCFALERNYRTAQRGRDSAYEVHDDAVALRSGHAQCVFVGEPWTDEAACVAIEGITTRRGHVRDLIKIQVTN
jgi:hypothetical protein